MLKAQTLHDVCLLTIFSMRSFKDLLEKIYINERHATNYIMTLKHVVFFDCEIVTFTFATIVNKTR